jgi:hypothetical protein
MGAVSEGISHVGGLLAGAVVGKILANKFLASVDAKYTALGQVAVGIALPRFVKNKFIGAMGQGMIVNGGMSALSAFGILSGIGADESPMLEYVGGSTDIATIAGDDDYMGGSETIQTIAGMDDEIGAFEDEMYS